MAAGVGAGFEVEGWAAARTPGSSPLSGLRRDVCAPRRLGLWGELEEVKNRGHVPPLLSVSACHPHSSLDSGESGCVVLGTQLLKYCEGSMAMERLGMHGASYTNKEPARPPCPVKCGDPNPEYRDSGGVGRGGRRGFLSYKYF